MPTLAGASRVMPPLEVAAPNSHQIHIATMEALDGNSRWLKRVDFANSFADRFTLSDDQNPFVAVGWHAIDNSRLYSKNDEKIDNMVRPSAASAGDASHEAAPPHRGLSAPAKPRRSSSRGSPPSLDVRAISAWTWRPPASADPAALAENALVQTPSAATSTVAKSSPATTCAAHLSSSVRSAWLRTALPLRKRGPQSPPLSASDGRPWRCKTCAIHLTPRGRRARRT